MSLHGSESKDQFVELITQHRGAMFGYILALVHNNADAEDLLQQTCLVLWRKFDQYDSAGNFVHWANKIAQYEVQNFFRLKGRDHVVFGSDLLNDLAVTATARV
jgi:RNA polymerase sigma-70 factor (ECF subfamily)